jgi:hypothetical protein
MTRARPGPRRQRGTVDELPSGALRVRVYAGADPVTGRRHDLVEVIPAEVLFDALLRQGEDETRVAAYELEVRQAGGRELIRTFVASGRRQR